MRRIIAQSHLLASSSSWASGPLAGGLFAASATSTCAPFRRTFGSRDPQPTTNSTSQQPHHSWDRRKVALTVAAGTVAVAAAIAIADAGSASRRAHAESSTRTPPSAEELSQEGAHSIRTSQGLEGKLDGMFYHGGEKAEGNPYGHAEPTQSRDAIGLPILDAQMSAAPAAPPPCARDRPAHIVAELQSITRTLQISGLHKYRAWTFNGTIPGPMIRCRVGDVLELRHTNKDEDGIGHNIDMHSVTGPGGGAAVTYADVGETKVGTFKMLYPGAFFYHCAAAPLPTHIANGMYGVMVVEPEGGMPPVDKEFYVVQNEFYGEESSEEKGMLDYAYFEGLREQPTYVVFNGAEGALTEKAPLLVDQGDRVRIWFANAGPNLSSSFHVIGAIFDKVYRDGDLISPPARGLAAVLVPPGGATVVEFTTPVPGALTIVDHAIFRTDKGAVGFIKVRPKGGDRRRDIYDSADPPNPCPGCKMHN